MNVRMPYSINSHAKRLANELVITPLKFPPGNNNSNEINSDLCGD